MPLSVQAGVSRCSRRGLNEPHLLSERSDSTRAVWPGLRASRSGSMGVGDGARGWRSCSSAPVDGARDWGSRSRVRGGCDDPWSWRSAFGSAVPRWWPICDAWVSRPGITVWRAGWMKRGSCTSRAGRWRGWPHISVCQLGTGP